MSENEHDDVEISIGAIGPGPETTEEVSRAVLDHPLVREELGGTRHRLLSVRFVESAGGKRREPAPQTATATRSLRVQEEDVGHVVGPMLRPVRW